MTGKEKIIERIRLDGEEAVKQIKDNAEAEVKAISQQAEKDAERLAEQIIAAEKAECAKLLKNAQSSRNSATKSKLLNCRRQQIDVTLKMAVDKLCNLPDEEYFAKILQLAGGYANLGGEILFSAKDLARLPSDMQSKLNQVGVDSVISKDTANICGGFVIKNGDILYSADFSSIAEEKLEQIEDMINRNLFAE